MNSRMNAKKGIYAKPEEVIVNDLIEALENGDCIRTEENHSRTTQKQITQYFSWVKDKSKIKNVSQSYLDNLLGA